MPSPLDLSVRRDSFLVLKAVWENLPSQEKQSSKPLVLGGTS